MRSDGSQGHEAKVPRPVPADEYATVESLRARIRDLMTSVPAKDLPCAIETVAIAAVPCRIYRPTPAMAEATTMVFFHGGGFVAGDLDTHDWLARELAVGAGAVVISVGYRLAPEHPYPAAMDDGASVLTTLIDRPAAFGVDPRRLAVVGESAGGNLAAGLALDRRFTGKLRSQILFYPVLDHYDAAHPSYGVQPPDGALTGERMRWYWDRYLPDAALAADPLVSPLRALDLRDAPPAFILTAAFDPLRDEGELYGARLRQAGIRAESICAGGVGHGFLLSRHTNAAARNAFDAAIAWCTRHVSRSEATS